MPENLQLPVLPLRDSVLFPGVSLPIGVGRAGTLRAVEAALRRPDKLIFALTQRQNIDQVSIDGLYNVGTIASIGQVQRGLNGMQLQLHGERRGMVVRIQDYQGYLLTLVREPEELFPPTADDPAFLALHREARERANELGRRSGLPEELLRQVLAGVQEPGRLADFVAAYVEVPTPDRQGLLETLSVEERLRRVLIQVERQLSVLEAQEEIQSKVREELGDRQREIYLREQLKAIQKELGEGDESNDLTELREKLDALQVPEAVKKEVDREWRRLERIGREAMESQVIRTFLEIIAELPWNKRSEEHLDIQEAANILDEDHYGLKDVKDRVLEFLAVRQLRKAMEASEEKVEEALPESEAAAAETPAASQEPTTQPEPAAQTASATQPEPAIPGNPDDKGAAKGPILLFVGPPGVGKTSVARSIARAMGREYVRISLGGARDEADIRGHRRTYVGAMPGRIVQGMKQAGTKNPVFLLDEVDKLGVSFQGDPAAALLEVLDPAQNDSFTDHYLGVPFDLSEVLFIATANYLEAIPAPLLDRMETVEFSGYTEAEKLAIARQFLLPRQLHDNGLNAELLALADSAISEVIVGYTRESGVRQLERELGKLCRKVARKIAAKDVTRMEVAAEQVRDLLGRPRVHPERAAGVDQVGIATGMFYTPAGGDIMFVEASVMRGKGELVLTGQLGEVMKESARAAWSYARAHAAALGIPESSFERDVHVHVPAGAVPKEGPSSGVAMASALVSALSARPVRHDLAMTGEITLSGRVLPIGGLKEKILGAVRSGITCFVIPRDNEADLEDLPPEVQSTIEVHLVSELGEVLALALRGASFREGQLHFDELPGRDLLGSVQH